MRARHDDYKGTLRRLNDTPIPLSFPNSAHQ